MPRNLTVPQSCGKAPGLLTSSRLMKCVLPSQLLKWVTAITGSMYRDSNETPDEAGLAISSPYSSLSLPNLEAMMGSCLRQNFILTKVNMYAIVAATSDWLKDEVRKTHLSQLPKESEAENEAKPQAKHVKGKKGADRRRTAPNYFVAVQITNPAVRASCSAAQQMLLEKGRKHLAPALVKPAKFHLTLMVMHLSPLSPDSSTEDAAVAVGPIKESSLEMAKKALDACGKQLMDEQEELITLVLRGVHSFGGQVVYACVEESIRLKRLAEIIVKEFGNVGIESTDQRAFSPHLTLMKLSQARGRKAKGLKRIDPHAYADIANTYFGEQTVGSLQLCAMHSKIEQESGYYTVAHEVTLTCT